MPSSGQTGEGPWRTDVRGERAGLQRMSEEVRKETLASIQDLRAEWWLKNCFYLERKITPIMNVPLVHIYKLLQRIRGRDRNRDIQTCLNANIHLNICMKGRKGKKRRER